ncbi:HAD family hydrolase [Nonomuraea wenchangensis]|uniref:Haloacid dehalogenase superfamily, subfamily IA, variant 1 with third motif having Dx(3-4)D or Dx(3-4)E n=1 Tax=Nonomuraea wenchangensis TaxID=568860 RepID=A0A1I0KHH1_9ACTN|nr:HAD family hydrolase [Nonomuraea wenchangensis]SEU23982.1 haloacid dehalogenase superfamily, subfamily IA, variant 1 with third motif having Dx(3-4)D or Dx(3-4)E [Nonomuraea wenchangensis]
MIRPKALLLDFGGVLVETARRPSWAAELAAEVHGLLARAGFDGLGVAEVEADVRAGARADSYWKDSTSRLPAPREMTHREFWADYVTADWPEQARALVAVEATPLCRRMGELRSGRELRPGTEELLAACRERAILPAVVSNALCGAVHRDFLARAGLDHLFAAQVYSDEVGVRKPNPEMIRLACRALGADPAETWYVGDNHDRDVVCGVRAGAGATVLMVSRSTAEIPYRVRQRPDATVDDPRDLLNFLETTWTT